MQRKNLRCTLPATMDIDRRSLLYAFGIGSLTPLISAQSPLRKVAVAKPGESRYKFTHPQSAATSPGVRLWLFHTWPALLPYWQLGNLNDASRVCQLNVPLEAMYSLAYQNVQSSTGSSAMLL